jgi:hypothetical protein
VISVRKGSPVQRIATERSHHGERLVRVSERVVVAKKPGNAGGAKGPYFRHAVQRGKGKVIDDESRNTH